MSNVNKPAEIIGKILYADNTVTSDVIDGTYSAQRRSGGGHDGNAYATIQAAISAMEAGDVLLLRGGTFQERSIRHYTTVAGEFELSESYYGTFDQGGNVWEWNETILYTNDRYLRGGYWGGYSSFLHASSPGNLNPAGESRALGVPRGKCGL